MNNIFKSLVFTGIMAVSSTSYGQTNSEYASLGDAALSNGEYDKAVENYKKALELDATNCDFMSAFRLGNAYEEMGRDAEAIDSYKSSIAKGYFERDIFRKIKTLSENVGGDQFLIKVYNEIAAEVPAQATYINENLFYLYSKNKMNDQALESSRKVLAEDPDNFRILKNTGFIYNSINKTDSVIHYLDKALVINNDDAAVHKVLGYLYYNICKVKQEKEINTYEKGNKDRSSYNKMMYNRQELARNYYPKALKHLNASNTLKNDGDVVKMIVRLDEAMAAYKK